MSSKDVFFVGLNVNLLRFWIVSWEAILGIWNCKPTVGTALQATPDTSACGCSSQTDVKKASEWSRALVVFFDFVVRTIDFVSVSLVSISKLHEYECGSEEKVNSSLQSRRKHEHSKHRIHGWWTGQLSTTCQERSLTFNLVSTRRASRSPVQ